MKETKFRVWNNDTKKWANPDKFVLTHNGRLMQIERIRNDFVEDEDNEILTSPQCSVTFGGLYTGHKDNHQNEIYKGDIVQTYCYNKIHKHEVKQLDCGQYSAGGYKLNAIYFVGGGMDFKKLGNIYENPELLK